MGDTQQGFFVYDLLHVEGEDSKTKWKLRALCFKQIKTIKKNNTKEQKKSS